MKALLPVAAIVLSGCTHLSPPAGPQQSFFSSLTSLCGKAFEGRIVSPPTPLDASFAGKKLVMHVRDCSAGSVRIPFHVGEDRSRTWVVTKTGSGLRLKHDHRHEDGSPDAQTQYGGDTVGVGAPTRQQFPADSYSKDLFIRGKTPQSASNIWAMEVVPAELFSYELRRPNRHFRVEFDLTRPVAPPPPPWGSR